MGNGYVVTGKVVNSDLIAFAGLQMIGLFGLNGNRLDCIGTGCIWLHSLDWLAIDWVALDAGCI